jgi:histidinol-phosphate aminotransferase
MNQKCKAWLNRKIARIQGLETYGAEQTNEAIAKKYGLQPAQILKLNYNENLFLPKDKIVSLLKEVAEECDLRIYPQEEENQLRKKISEYLRVPEECIALGNSSDEVMDRIIRIFLEKGDRAVTFAPTFSIFRYCVKYCDAELESVPLREDFTLDTNALLSTFSPQAKLLYLCSPNNPTANQLKLEEIEILAKAFPGIVLVDEAYAEYADFSVIPLIRKYENVVVLRTFSKAFGLAGLRLGYALASPSLAQSIDKLPTPYAVNVVSLSMGRKLLENMDIVTRSVEELKIERAHLIGRMNKVSGLEAFDSKTNFVLFKSTTSSSSIYSTLLREGIIIKKLGRLLEHENCLRSTVGTPEMNRRLLDALESSLGEIS